MNYHEISTAQNVNYRKSGFLLAGIFALIHTVLFMGGEHRPYIALIAIVMAVLASFEAWPLRKFIDLFIDLGKHMNQFTNPLFLGLMYIIAVIPTSLVLKLLGKDILQLRYDTITSSYWKERDNNHTWKESFRNRF